MGIVYLAHHPEHGTVALKTLRKDTNAFALRSIRLESTLLSRLKHPGVVRLLEHGIEDHIPWVALEFLQGNALATLIAASETKSRTNATYRSITTSELHKGMAATLELGRTALRSEASAQTQDPSTFEPDETVPLNNQPAESNKSASDRRGLGEKKVSRNALLGWLGQVCRTLGYVHGQGLVHADIKPGNIIVTHEGRAILVDFGLACPFGSRVSTQAMDRAGLLAGSLFYISPEQIRGESLDARADLYALGCILFELFAGHPPFHQGSSDALMSQHIKTLAPPLLEAQAPSMMRELVASLLSKERYARPGHVQAVLHQLEQMGITTSATAASVDEVPVTRPYLYKAVLAGRGALLERLGESFEQALEGHGGFILLKGESGVGKTRLVMELIREARRSGESRILIGHGARSTGQPLGMFVPVLETIVYHCRQRGVETSMRMFPPEDAAILAPFAPSIGELNGVDVSKAVLELPLQASRTRLFGRLLRVLMRLSMSGPKTLLIVLDDLQWADELSLAFMRYLSKRVAQHPWLVVGTVRAQASNPELDVLLTEHREQVWAVEGLDRDAVERIIVQMLGQTPDDAVLKAVSGRSNGNPFFVAEYLHLLTNEGYLQLDEVGRWRLSNEALEAKTLPKAESIRALVGNRLGHLSIVERQLCGAAAVLGRRMQLMQLRNVAQMAETQFDETLGRLYQLQVLEPDEQPRQVRFIHDKLREATYAQLATEQKVRLHARVALSWEAREQNGELVDLALLAWHWAQGQCPTKARQRYVEAARHAMTRFALSSAKQHFLDALHLFESDELNGAEVHIEFIEDVLLKALESEKVITHSKTLLERLERTPEDTRRLQARAHLAWGNAFWPRPEGRFREYREQLEKGLLLAEQLGEEEIRAQALRSLGRITLSESNWSEEASAQAIGYFRGAITVFEAVGDHKLQAQLHHDIGETYSRLYQEEEALESYRNALALYQIHAPYAAGPTLKGLGRLLKLQLYCDRALTYFEQALALARTSGDYASQIFLLFLVNNTHALHGKFKLAIKGYNTTRELAERLDETRARIKGGAHAIFLSEVGLFQAHLGNMKLATKMVDESVALSLNKYGEMFTHGRLRSQAAIAMLCGDLDKVIQISQRVVEELDTSNLIGRYHIGLYLMSLSQVHYLRGDLKEAEALCRKAIDGQNHDHFTDIGSGQAELGKIILAQGRTEEARRLLKKTVDGMAQHEGYPLLDETLASLYLAMAHRTSKALDEAQQQMDSVLSNYRQMGYKVMLTVALCEQGHLALARGTDVTPWLEEATLLTQSLDLYPQSQALLALAVLRKSIVLEQE